MGTLGDAMLKTIFKRINDVFEDSLDTTFNECFIDKATDIDSILNLAELVGYRKEALEYLKEKEVPWYNNG